jgi:hypothetical protein
MHDFHNRGTDRLVVPLLAANTLPRGEIRQVDTCHSNISFLATAPPRDVSTKLVDRALPSILNETKLNIKKDAGLLLANLAEIDCTTTV